MAERATVRGLTVVPRGGGAPVVDGVGFTVAAGERLGVTGRSGSGKTTTALALLGHVRPGLVRAAGAVRVGGIDPFTADGARRVRGRAVSFLGQDPAAALNPSRRLGAQVGEAVRLRSPGSDTAQVLRGLLASVSLPADRAFLRRFPHQVSGGQARRVALALALAGDPSVLVLDEPTAGLDAVAAATVRDLLAETLTGRAVVLVSHDAHLVASLTGRAVVLRDGRIVDDGPPARVLAPALAPIPVPDGPAPAGRPGRGLRVSGLGAGYGRTPVLEDVSLDVDRGECLAVVGPSGSGKSTLARCVAGLHVPTAGTLTLDGRPLAGRVSRRGAEQRRSVALVAQDSVGALNPAETVAAALARPLRRIGGLRGADVPARTAALLDRVHLPSALAGRRPAELSGGERQRVNLARALAAGPSLLVCDEITSALDPEIAAAVVGLVDELRRDGGPAVLLVTHDLGVVARGADRVLVLGDGRVVEHGPTARILSVPEHELTARLVGAAPAVTVLARRPS